MVAYRIVLLRKCDQSEKLELFRQLKKLKSEKTKISHFSTDICSVAINVALGILHALFLLNYCLFVFFVFHFPVSVI